MEKKPILLLKAFELGGKPYDAGTWMEIDGEAADILVARGIAKAQTLEEHMDEKAKAADDAEKAKAAEEAKKLETTVVTNMKERLADDPKGGFRLFADFMKEVAVAGIPHRGEPERLMKWRHAVESRGKTLMTEREDEQGGYTVPTQFVPRLLMRTMEGAIVRSRATFVPMQTNRITFPAVSDASHAGGILFGGIRVYRPGEGEEKYPSKPRFEQVSLELHEMIVLVYVTNILLEDSPISLEPLLNDMVGQAIAFTEDDDFINSGTGVNMPLSPLNAVAPIGCTIAQPRQLPGRITGMDIVRMVSRLYSPSLANAVWLINNDTLPMVMTANYIPVGTVTPIPLFIASGQGSQPVRGLVGTILGRPCLMTEKCQPLGTMGDIMLADWSQYLIGGKVGSQEPVLTTSIHVRFVHDQKAFRFVLRLDGQPWWRTPLTPRHSLVTVSPFVVLSDTGILTTTTTPAPTTTTMHTTTATPTTTTP